MFDVGSSVLYVLHVVFSFVWYVWYKNVLTLQQ